MLEGTDPDATIDIDRSSAEFVLHYCAHDPATTPFLAGLAQGPFGSRVEVHLGAGASDAAGQVRHFDAGAVLAIACDAHVYVCGPARLQDSVIAAALEWDPTRVHHDSL